MEYRKRLRICFTSITVKPNYEIIGLLPSLAQISHNGSSKDGQGDMTDCPNLPRLSEKSGLARISHTILRSVPMHGISEDLLNLQVSAIGLPLYCVEVGDENKFEQQNRAFLNTASEQKVIHIAFGDLFREDVRSRRIEKMKDTDIGVIFPLWEQSTNCLAKNIICSGFKAIVTNVDLRVLSTSFLGRSFDEKFINDLPSNVDPCGENGEFHTFVFDGPIFQHAIKVNHGKIAIEGNHASIQLHFG